jgi:hypothetical protein
VGLGWRAITVAGISGWLVLVYEYKHGDCSSEQQSSYAADGVERMYMDMHSGTMRWSGGCSPNQSFTGEKPHGAQSSQSGSWERMSCGAVKT